MSFRDYVNEQYMNEEDLPNYREMANLLNGLLDYYIKESGLEGEDINNQTHWFWDMCHKTTVNKNYQRFVIMGPHIGSVFATIGYDKKKKEAHVIYKLKKAINGFGTQGDVHFDFDEFANFTDKMERISKRKVKVKEEPKHKTTNIPVGHHSYFSSEERAHRYDAAF